MERRAATEHETSNFESTEMLAAYLASTPLLEESWRLCAHANAAAQQSFAAHRAGRAAFVAFSGVQAVQCAGESCPSLVDLEAGTEGIFRAFCRGGRREGTDQSPLMVHGGLLRLFLSFYHSHAFQHQMLEIINGSKSVVFTGHSLGGAIASLSALWLLSVTQTNSPPINVLCITYGSPLLVNESFSQAIIQERWSGNFCHVVAQHDVVPRMLFAPADHLVSPFLVLFQFWQLSMASPNHLQLASQLSHEIRAQVFNTILSYTDARATGGEDQKRNSFCPFGSYMLCTEKGAICLDNRMAIVKLLHLMLAKGSPESFVTDHLKYGDYVGKVIWQYLQRRSLTDMSISESSNEAGIALALHSSGIYSQEPMYEIAKDTLAIARKLGCKRNLNSAKMAVSLAKITPLRAQIEWYKAFCESSDDQLGYYDAFRRRAASKRDYKVNMNRVRLGQFWDDLIYMLETNQLTHDFHLLAKYVNASQYYKLLVEPLEIAEYYRTLSHKKRGHYIEHGREKRFKIFDKWWKDREVGNEESNPRTTFASLTQDSCFWARVEEAMDSIYLISSGMDSGRRLILLDKINKFEQYARGMIERKEVSVDVQAKNSSYNLFLEEWRVLKSRLHDDSSLPPGFHDGKLVS